MTHVRMGYDMMSIGHAAAGVSAAGGVRRSLPPRAAGETISDGNPDGRQFQRHADLRGAEWKPNASTEVPLERYQEELLHCKSCILQRNRGIHHIYIITSSSHRKEGGKRNKEKED